MTKDARAQTISVLTNIKAGLAAHGANYRQASMHRCFDAMALGQLSGRSS